MCCLSAWFHTWSSMKGDASLIKWKSWITGQELLLEHLRMDPCVGLLCCFALGVLCAVGDAVKGCATHTAGMSCMQSIESVSSGRQGGRRRRRRGGGSLEETGSSRWGLLRRLLHEKDEAQNSLPLLSSPLFLLLLKKLFH